MQWWKASKYSWGKRVEPVEIEKATEQFVTIGGRRSARESSMYAYLPTQLGAWDWIENALTHRIQGITAELQTVRSELGKVQSERKAAGC